MTRQGAGVNRLRRVRRGVAVLAVLCAALWYAHAAWAGPEAEAPAGVDALVLAGSQALYDGNVQEAERYLRRAVEADPHSVFAMNQLGAALARQKHFTEAGRMFTRVLALDEGNLFALIWRGVLALEAGRPGAARRAFGAVLERDAANPDALYFLGVVHASARDRDGAVRYFTRAGQAAMRLGGDPEAQYRLGVAYRGLGLAANAELAFERALALRPRYGMALVELGWVRLNRGDRAGAEAAWTRAAGLGGRAAEEARTSMAATLTRDAIAAQEAGNTAEERTLWGRVLEWDPENRAARHHLR